MTTQVSPVDSTFGVLLVGTFIGLLIYGLNVHVTYLYYVSYPDDSTMLKAFVAIMFSSITVFGIATTHLSYYYLVTAAYPYSEASGLQPLWILQVLPLSAAVTIFLVQGFYARRIFLFSRRARVMVISTVLLMIAGLGLCTGVTVKMVDTHADMSQWKRFTGFDSTILTLFVAVDVLLTSTLIFLLRQSRTVFKRSNMVINTLIAHAVIGTSLMSLASIPSFILAFVLPEKFYYMGTSIPAVHLYPVTVLVVLNARASLRERGMGMGDSTMIDLSVFRQVPTEANQESSQP